MCKINKLSEAMQKVVIETVKGQTYTSEAYEDSEKVLIGRSSKAQAVYEEMLEDHCLTNFDVAKVYIIRQKDDDTVYISEHAFQRMKERNGWNSKAAMRMVRKVVDEGTHKKDMTAEIRKWAEQVSRRQEGVSDIILYGTYTYIFADNTLLTTYPMPNDLNRKYLVRTGKGQKSVKRPKQQKRHMSYEEAMKYAY